MKIYGPLEKAQLEQYAIQASDVEGRVAWDATNDVVKVSTGAAVKTMQDLESAQSVTGQKTFAEPILGAATGTSLALGGALGASAVLDAQSTTKGFLPPRMTTTQRDAIGSPAEGLEIYNTTTHKANVYNGTSWVEMGAGGGSGINYILAPDAESGVGAWATYADAAGTSPVDGTGGSPSSTFAVSSSTAMRGLSNFLFTHSANNRQGEGFSYDFTIDASDKGKVLKCSLEYLVASGAYADGDLTCWIFDVTNSVMIQPAPYRILNSTLIEKFAFEFQTAINSTSYRLNFHVSTATATAYTMRFDNFILGPQAKLYGSPITDWVSYTPTYIGLGSTSTTLAQWRRVGSDMEVKFDVVIGTGTATTALISLPSGFSCVYANADVGDGSSTDLTYSDLVMWNNDSTHIAFMNSNAATTAFINGNQFTAGKEIWGKFKVPIQGWSSSQVMSSDADTRVVAARATRGGIDQANINTAATQVKLLFNSISGGFDKNGAYDTTNSKYIVQVAGTYRVSANAVFDATNVLANEYALGVFVNGSAVVYLADFWGRAATSLNLGGSTVLDGLKSGDYIELYLFGAGNNSVNKLIMKGTNSLSWFTVERLSGPAQIAASESVSAKYTCSNAQVITNSNVAVITTLTKIYDSHSGMNATTGVYSVPVSGKYRITIRIAGASAAYTTGSNRYIEARVTGSQTLGVGIVLIWSSMTNYLEADGSVTVAYNAGDTISMSSSNQSGSSFTLDGSGTTICIERVGN